MIAEAAPWSEVLTGSLMWVGGIVVIGAVGCLYRWLVTPRHSWKIRRGDRLEAQRLERERQKSQH